MRARPGHGPLGTAMRTSHHSISPACLLLVAWGLPGGAQEIETVLADGPPVWGENPRLIEEVRIGTVLGAAEYAFGHIGGVAVTDDGTIWVGDRQLGALRRYRPDGTYIDQIGREGEGPGEFEYPFGMRVLADGSVAVWDDGLLRVTRFTDDGTYIDSFSPPTHMAGGNLEEFEVDVEGNLYILATNLASLSREQLVDPRNLRRFWLKTTLEGEIVDTVHISPMEGEGSVDRIVTVTALSPLGYLVTGRNDEYALDLHLEPGRTLRIERPWQPMPYQRAERREKQRLEEVMVGRNGRPLRRIPGDKPAFSHFEVDRQGRIWVQVYTRGVLEPETPGEEDRRREACAFFGATEAECDEGITEWRQPLVFEVLEPDGRYLGRLELPNRRADVYLARDDLLWVVETGELGEQYVVRYRIELGG